MTLTSMALGQMNWTKRAALAVAGSVLIALAAQVSVPFYPVPMTLQTLAVLFVGLAFGARMGAATVALYLAEGLAGLPVFANGMNGVAFAGPTAGFLVGFVAMAAIAGLAAGRGLAAMIGAALVASAVLYVFGLAWPMGVAGALGVGVWGQDLATGELLGAFMTPFLLGDAIKAVLAAVIVAGGVKALHRA
ncbi:biotin transporter BioY [Jannaschia sp. W003]|uniref:biotin transporter BioY n=1 Tax=Jannaschia sp. W003 TaxID=2867012 RepID=UPI0021A6F287|nr:biotin transporter BioY [Jannaschia sp. W003]UWQ20675.1 biotin transporter BioY [Jannaschia sp. W003]